MGKFIRAFIILVALLLVAQQGFSVPSNSISIPNSFSPLTTALSALVNADFNECQSKFNAHTHTDITALGGVTSGTWAASVIQPAYGGSGKDFSAVASGSVIYFNGTGTETTLAKSASGAILFFDGTTLQPNWLGQGITGQVLSSNGPSQAPTWIGAGKLVQSVNNATGAVLTTADVKTIDDNIPTTTDLTKDIITATITPTASTSKLKITCTLVCTSSSGRFITAAIFQDATANALAAVSESIAAATEIRTIRFSHIVTTVVAGVPTQFKLRAGMQSAGTLTVNGTGGSRIYGGVCESNIQVEEIAQ